MRIKVFLLSLSLNMVSEPRKKTQFFPISRVINSGKPSFLFPVSSTPGNLPVIVFHSGHLPHLSILSDQLDRRQKRLTVGELFPRTFSAKSFSDTDHTKRSAWRRSPTFVKAPEPKDHPRAIFRPATESHTPAREGA